MDTNHYSFYLQSNFYILLNITSYPNKRRYDMFHKKIATRVILSLFFHQARPLSLSLLSNLSFFRDSPFHAVRTIVRNNPSWYYKASELQTRNVHDEKRHCFPFLFLFLFFIFNSSISRSVSPALSHGR